MSDLFPPFAPDPDEPRKRLFKPVPFRVIVPNIITLIALCLGLTAIRLAFEGRYEPAVIAIVAAAFLDGVDGRVARLLKGTSRFGAELDSLADFVNFGVTPALILYSFLLNELKALGWIAVLVFAIAMALRLARFNVMLDDPHRPEWKKNFFTGMPAPAGALTSMLPLYLSFLGVSVGAAAAPIALVYLLGLAFLMVSTIPVYSGKTIGLKVPRQWVLPIFVLSVAAFGLLVSFPFEMLTVITVCFLGSIPFSVMRYRQLARADAMQAAEARQAPSEQETPLA
ncbi:CDP-diacylglycerol--serine O-phosphatidyltransferase [Microvirga aerilata]|uniref:CDP-diacylglycerol--serine O-phosphatidyltransferase n=1 Tax=Microvirga aerilata TaxID=670292 RepID=A0A936ZAH6_9HYPH|nr:CDP-diacylglycerol--serine O-phosphatidyltransferase [Microvirga aerilata]MBL0402859.1 CDP-diacylglycerol--serine O-phosphatidyltransferase [Microvirga aerilata]